MRNDHASSPRIGLFARVLRRIARGESGNALVELAVLLPIFSSLIVAGAEFARLEFAAIEVANAAHAGAVYGSQTEATAGDTTGIQNAATSDAANVTSLSASSSKVCICSDGTTSITCSTTSQCPARVIHYVQVNTTAVVDPIFHLPGLPKTYTYQSSAMMRVQQQ